MGGTVLQGGCRSAPCQWSWHECCNDWDLNGEPHQFSINSSSDLRVINILLTLIINNWNCSSLNRFILERSFNIILLAGLISCVNCWCLYLHFTDSRSGLQRLCGIERIIQIRHTIQLWGKLLFLPSLIPDSFGWFSILYSFYLFVSAFGNSGWWSICEEAASGS